MKKKRTPDVPESVRPGVSFTGRAVRIAVVWMAWIYAGATMFGLPYLLREKVDLVAALAAAPKDVKIYFGIWLLGSIMLCAFLLISLRQAFGYGLKKP